ncbi:hypothetical protein HZH68_013295 [Vespula germanica]|uniref:Uncharacterized protein n=1 Tax=Vespula germanica TaxID=30212 RepID=A0A834MWY9_VESGE|nr:hypothetical protein HZH68_013295 [Vespula germanica]
MSSVPPDVHSGRYKVVVGVGVKEGVSTCGRSSNSNGSSSGSNTTSLRVEHISWKLTKEKLSELVLNREGKSLARKEKAEWDGSQRGDIGGGGEGGGGRERGEEEVGVEGKGRERDLAFTKKSQKTRESRYAETD